MLSTTRTKMIGGEFCRGSVGGAATTPVSAPSLRALSTGTPAVRASFSERKALHAVLAARCRPRGIAQIGFVEEPSLLLRANIEPITRYAVVGQRWGFVLIVEERQCAAHLRIAPARAARQREIVVAH